MRAVEQGVSTDRLRQPTDSTRSVPRSALAAVLLLASVLRLYALRDVPAGFFCDEAALGYNAYTIGTAGVDEYGRAFPLFFWSFGVSYKNPVFVYAAALPIKLLGLDELSTRLTSALFGIGTVVAMFFLGRDLFDPWVGLFAALFLAICPWHLHFSRIAFELISFPFLFVIGLILAVRFTHGRRTLPTAMLFFGLCAYAYAIAKLFVPLFLLVFVALYFSALRRRWREALLALVVLLLTVAPVVVFDSSHRRSATQYFRETTMLSEVSGWGDAVERLRRNYRAFFSPAFLLTNGDPMVRHAVRGFGELPPLYAPCLILGAAVIALRRGRIHTLVLWWLALYPVGPSLMTEIPSASRGIIGAPAFCLLAAVGFTFSLDVLGRWHRWRALTPILRTTALVVAGCLLATETAQYLRAYFIDYPKYSAATYEGFQYGYRDTIRYMDSQRSRYDRLMLTTVQVNQPQVFALFYSRVPPLPQPLELNRWYTRPDLGYVILDPAEFVHYSMDRPILYQLRPSDLRLFSDYTIQKRIVAPGGQEEFVIAEVRRRKHFLSNWRVLGLFPNENGEGIDREFIDIRQLGPDTDRFGTLQWQPLTGQFAPVDLNRIFSTMDPMHAGNPDHVCAYAAIDVRSPRRLNAFLELTGSDDSLRDWLNGGALTDAAVRLGDEPQRQPITLLAGDNLLVVKSCENVGTWYFLARITDAAGEDVPELSTFPRFPPPRQAPDARPHGGGAQGDHHE